MIYDSGLITVCELVNVAAPGDMPCERLKARFSAYFGEIRAGITRIYLAKGAGENVDLFVQIPDEGFRPAADEYAVIQMYNGHGDDADDKQYRITALQSGTDDDGHRVYDIQLTRLERNYELLTV